MTQLSEFIHESGGYKYPRAVSQRQLTLRTLTVLKKEGCALLDKINSLYRARSRIMTLDPLTATSSMTVMMSCDRLALRASAAR